ncbi:MAG TPA: PIN domain-containing protein [Actinophytocola sp.]|uniref:type II toxin-antitoxin system VapC family toxin n=1 Tax=Actinophytocola sp. TaxID=1872138 RepID=UPI002DDCC1CA|nr:PIN domain-containing protein [Actinophytocola sp.]HEV2778004.1 PIN domain-containing protein [Actinophytocola sp.]
MIVVDTSVWIDWFADRSTPQVEYFADCLERTSEDFALVALTYTEILQGLRDDKDVRRVERNLSAFTILGLSHMSDFRAGAGLYRAARKNGFTIRSTIDCLIAAVCIREDLQLLHSDRDFDRLAELTTLSVVDY